MSILVSAGAFLIGLNLSHVGFPRTALASGFISILLFLFGRGQQRLAQLLK